MLRFVLTCMLSTICMAQKPVFITAKATHATVYQEGVELSHTFTANLPEGTSEIVLKNVADQIHESTIQIAAPKHITVLSAQFTTVYDTEYDLDETNPKIKQVKDSISLLVDNIQQVKNQSTSVRKTIELLDKNQIVYGNNSGLNIEDLKKMVAYYQNKRTDLSNTLYVLAQKETNLSEKIKKLRAKLDWNKQNETGISQGKLILQIMSNKQGKADFSLNYLSDYASWKPFYDLRAENISSPINLMYKAEIKQYTGLDWKKIHLTLSSGQPNQNNAAPILRAWFLRFGNNYDWNNSNVMLNSVTPGLKQTGAVDVVEEVELGNSISINENQLNTSFDIDIPYDIVSNNKAHSVSMKNLKIPATFSHYAVPKLDKNAYLLAFLEDYSQFNLLPGEANVIFEGLYVGRTYINPNETSDTLRLSMGKDKNITIKREKITDKSGTKFLSSNKEQVFTYDITVRNNKKESIELILKDQFPLSTDEKIEVVWKEDSGGKANNETGIITWNLKLKSGESVKRRIRYLVKYPNNTSIDNL